MPERRGHEKTIQPHFQCLCVDPGASKGMVVQWTVLGQTLCWYSGEVRREHFLKETEDAWKTWRVSCSIFIQCEVEGVCAPVVRALVRRGLAVSCARYATSRGCLADGLPDARLMVSGIEAVNAQETRSCD